MPFLPNKKPTPASPMTRGPSTEPDQPRLHDASRLEDHQLPNNARPGEAQQRPNSTSFERDAIDEIEDREEPQQMRRTETAPVDDDEAFDVDDADDLLDLEMGLKPRENETND